MGLWLLRYCTVLSSSFDSQWQDLLAYGLPICPTCRLVAGSNSGPAPATAKAAPKTAPKAAWALAASCLLICEGASIWTLQRRKRQSIKLSKEMVPWTKRYGDPAKLIERRFWQKLQQHMSSLLSSIFNVPFRTPHAQTPCIHFVDDVRPGR